MTEEIDLLTSESDKDVLSIIRERNKLQNKIGKLMDLIENSKNEKMIAKMRRIISK